MKKNIIITSTLTVALLFSLGSCNQKSIEPQDSAVVTQAAAAAGQSGVKDDQSQKDIVKLATGSKDHSTLVTALKAAEYVVVLSNSGPSMLFAPTNAAFDKLPAGTVEGLLKPESEKDLRNILEYHVFVDALKEEFLHDGQKLNQVNGDNVTVGLKDEKFTVN